MSVAENGVIYQVINALANTETMVVVHETPRMREQLRRSVPGCCKIVVLFSQGTNGATQLLKTIPEIARYYLQALDSLALRQPFVLVGFSIGGMIAYEMAQQMSQRGAAPRQLVMVSPSCGTLAYTLFDNRVMKAAQRAPETSSVPLLSRCVVQLRQYRYVLFVCRNWLRMRCAIAFNLPLAKHLIWLYLTPLYRHAAQQYLKRDYSDKVVIAYENGTAIACWLPYLKGEVEVLADLDCSHYDLVETGWARLWLDRIHVGNSAANSRANDNTGRSSYVNIESR